MSKPTDNRSASVRQRLYTIAKQSGRSFNELLLLYAMERFLYRLSCSPYRDRFVLKGALMLMAWDTGCNRTTRDIDLLGITAEKFEAMVKLGAINSRMKDFYDIWFLAGQFHFDQHKLGEAITATFQRRGTLLKSPVILTLDFDDLPAKQKQWMAFITKNRLEHAPGQFTSVTRIIRQFLAPYIDRQECGTSEAKEWIPKQGWKQ